MTNSTDSSSLFYLEVGAPNAQPQLVPMSAEQVAEIVAQTHYRVFVPHLVGSSYTFQEVGVIKSEFSLTQSQAPASSPSSTQEGDAPESPTDAPQGDNHQGVGVGVGQSEDAPQWEPVGPNEPSKVLSREVVKESPAPKQGFLGRWSRSS